MLDNRQKEAIGILRQDDEVDNNFLWLVETQTIEEAQRYYDNIWDLTRHKEEGQDSIIYYHENGSIHHSAVFDKDDDEDFKEAVEWIGVHLRGAEY